MTSDKHTTVKISEFKPGDMYLLRNDSDLSWTVRTVVRVTRAKVIPYAEIYGRDHPKYFLNVHFIDREPKLYHPHQTEILINR